MGGCAGIGSAPAPRSGIDGDFARPHRTVNGGPYALITLHQYRYFLVAYRRAILSFSLSASAWQACWEESDMGALLVLVATGGLFGLFAWLIISRAASIFAPPTQKQCAERASTMKRNGQKKAVLQRPEFCTGYRAASAYAFNNASHMPSPCGAFPTPPTPHERITRHIQAYRRWERSEQDSSDRNRFLVGLPALLLAAIVGHTKTTGAQEHVRTAPIQRNLLACDYPAVMAAWNEVLLANDASAFKDRTLPMMNNGHCSTFTVGTALDVARTSDYNTKYIITLLPTSARISSLLTTQ